MMTIAQYETNNISGSPFTFFDIESHGTMYTEPWEFEDTREIFYGVQGEQETSDMVHGRWLKLPVDLHSFESEDLLRSALNILNSYINQLKGPLTIDSSMTYQNVIFKGVTLGSPIQALDGPNSGYAALGCTLVWRQLSP